MKYFLAIDIGASSGRHIVAYRSGDKIVTEEIYRFVNLPEKVVKNDKKEHLVWNYEHLYKEILNGLKQAKIVGKIPSYIGIDTWGVDYALLDENDEVIDGIYCYRDSRTEDVINKVHSIIPFEELFHKTGISHAIFNTIYQLYCDRESGRMERAKTFLMLPDYFNFKLTGVKHQEYTNGTTTGMVNAISHTWDDEILTKLGYKKSLFASLHQPSTEVGMLCDEVAEFVGYNAMVMHPASHDTASAVLSAPLKEQTPYISSGTWSLLGIEQDHAYTSTEVMKTGYSNEGGLNSTFRLQINIMGLWMIQQVRHELEDKYSFAELADLARNNKFACDIDVNNKRYLAPKSMIDEIENDVGEKLTVGQLAYVIYDNLAKCYAKSIDDLERVTGKKYSTLNIIGGGSKNTLLNELTKIYTKKDVITGPCEGTALGNLLMQMVGAKEIKDVKEGRELIANSFDIDKVKLY